MNADEIVQLLDQRDLFPKRTGLGKWQSLCPAHDDRTPSLSIGMGADDRVLLHCQAGCDVADVLDRLGLTAADLYTPNGNGKPQPVEYFYEDAQGAVLFKVVRQPGKRFAQARLDGKGGWIWNLRGVERVLYRLPKVLAAVKAGETIYIAEGENDVQALERAGVIATTNPGGAGKWRSEYPKVLAGANIVIVADADQPGRDHATAVAKSLRAQKCTVRIAEPAKGKDAHDHLAAGFGIDEFNEMPEATNPLRVLPPPTQPMTVAREFSAAYYRHEHGSLLRHWRGAWWRWHGSHWSEVESRAVRAEIYGFTENATFISKKGEAEPWSPNRHRIADVMDALGGIVLLAQDVDQPSWIGRDHEGVVVACANGLLDVESRLLLDHTPTFFNQTSVPFGYDPESSAPARWLDFLGRLWGDDHDQVAALQEWFGYVISGRMDLHKILLIVGPTRAGKGVIARVLGSLIGRANVAGPTLSSLHGDFGLAPLIGKPLAVVADARLTGRDSSTVVERLLSISGEDILTVNIKYREQWSGKLPARFMILSNELPRLGDASAAITGRFVTLELTESWLGREDTTLEQSLQQELPGILSWALNGLARLTEKGRFTQPSSTQNALRTLQDLASPVGAFVRDACVIGPDEEVSVEALWKAWRVWAEDNGHGKGGTKQVFGRDLRAAIPRLRVRQIGERDDRERVYVGIGLKDAR
jgi:putative DNA primase/helicase